MMTQVLGSRMLKTWARITAVGLGLLLCGPAAAAGTKSCDDRCDADVKMCQAVCKKHAGRSVARCSQACADEGRSCKARCQKAPVKPSPPTAPQPGTPAPGSEDTQ